MITTERHEVFVIRQNGDKAVHGFCPACEQEVEMLTFDLAISFSGMRGRDLVRESEYGPIHSIETTGGHLLICKSSLAKEKKDEKQF